MATSNNMKRVPLVYSSNRDDSPYMGMIVISEFKWRTTNTEFIELYNRSNENINLQGWEINAIKWGSAGGSVGYGLPSIVMQPGEFITLCQTPAYDSWNEICTDSEWIQAYCPECNISANDCDQDLTCFIQNGCQIPGHSYSECYEEIGMV